jgi:hypothetical protein
MKKFLAYGCQFHTFWSAVRVSLVVGTVLNLINNYDVLVGAGLDAESSLKIALTYLVPHFVSTHGQVTAVIHAAKK